MPILQDFYFGPFFSPARVNLGGGKKSHPVLIDHEPTAKPKKQQQIHCSIVHFSCFVAPTTSIAISNVWVHLQLLEVTKTAIQIVQLEPKPGPTAEALEVVVEQKQQERP